MSSQRNPFWLLFLVLGLAGCSQDAPKEDAAFLRDPTAKVEMAAESGESLFPTRPGQTWQLSVYEPRHAPHEETMILKAGSAPNAPILETSYQGRLVRRERLLVRREGVYMTAMAASKDITFTPPLPILRFPLREGEYYNWEGKLGAEGVTASGTALSRVSGQDAIEIGGLTTQAYRVDTVITAVTNGTQRVDIPMVRWYAPRLGLVKQKLVVLDRSTEKASGTPQSLSVLKITRQYRP